MIPRLYEYDAATFNNFGICPLVDAISCEVTEERNGEYTLSMTYPKEGRWWEELAVDRIILAEPHDKADQAEPFRITSIEFDMNGDLSIEAEHISYQLNYVVVGQMNRYTRYPATCWDTIQEHLLTTNPFTFWTNISDDEGTVYNNNYETATPLRKILGGMRGSFLDNYGGEFEWNRYTVKLWASRGADNGVKIAYTKNLTGLVFNIDMSDVYTGVVAYYDSDGTYVEGTAQYVQNSYSFERVIVVDATEDFDDPPTAAQLDTWAAAYVAANAPSPKVSVEVEFVPLWQTEEYKDLYGLEHVSLCDTVEAIYPPLGIREKAKVVKTIYDVLNDRYKQITISTIKPDLADTIFSLMEAKQ